MKRKSRKRKHEIKAWLQVEKLSKAGSGLYLDIFADDENIGHVEIGRGSFGWKGKNKQTLTRISWSTFAELLDKHCYGE
jgi:hypothetical protein